jgi:hypothetical protein
VTETQHSAQSSIPQLARSLGATGSTAVADWTRTAATSVRRHRSEMVILAGTLAFVLLVLLLSLATAF